MTVSDSFPVVFRVFDHNASTVTGLPYGVFPKMYDWCMTNLSDFRWHVKHDKVHFYFENYTDAIKFRLAWDDGAVRVSIEEV